MLSVKNVTKTYLITKKDKTKKVTALNKVSIDFPETGLVFLLGKSGSGKSTLLNTIGGLDSFDSGEIVIKGKSSKDFSQSDFDSYRNTFIGFIFQEYNVLENFSVAKNLALAIELQGKKATKEDVDKLLNQVEMLEFAKRKPNQLSGGQKQRVAIARALIKNPEIIMADEPTGALDSTTGKQVMETLRELSKKKLVIIVSHDREFAEIYGDRIIELKDGKIISDVTKKHVDAEHTKSGVSVVENRYIHIKKGQKVTKEDVELIVNQINSNSESDTIISFNEKTNKTIKNVEFIQDDGSKQAFLETKQEDIKTKTYDGKSLKLIKSHLKFSDSFKMGAGALKHKMGRLIFTIIMSVIAFTMFGVVDSFACWQRGTAVYHNIEKTNQKVISFNKFKKGEWGDENAKATMADFDALKEKFPDYTYYPMVSLNGGGYSSAPTVKLEGNSNQIYFDSSSSNPAKTPNISKAIYVSDVSSLGFELTAGRLPTADNEIAISKHNWDCMKENETLKGVTDITKVSIKVSVSYSNSDDNSSYKKIVGIVDTKDDLSKYLNMDKSEISNKRYEVEQALQVYSYRYVFVTNNFLNALTKETENSYGSSSYVYAKFGDVKINYGTSYRYFKCLDFETKYQEYLADHNTKKTQYEQQNIGSQYPSTAKTKQEFLSADYFYENSASYYGFGITDTTRSFFDAEDKFIPLKDNEIIIPKDYLSGVINYQEDLTKGVKFSIYEDYDNKKLIKEFTVVGVNSSAYNNRSNIYASDNISSEYLAKLQGYDGFVTVLKGNSSDKNFIEYCEKYNSNNIRFVVQNELTQTLNQFEYIIMSLSQAFMYVGIVLAIFAGLMLMGFISQSINYKKREIGVLRALGARGSDVLGIFLNESSIISLINFVISTIATFIVCTLLNAEIIKQANVNITLLSPGIRQLFLILAVSFGSAFISSSIPVMKISRKKPIDAINNR